MATLKQIQKHYKKVNGLARKLDHAMWNAQCDTGIKFDEGEERSLSCVQKGVEIFNKKIESPMAKAMKGQLDKEIRGW